MRIYWPAKKQGFIGSDSFSPVIAGLTWKYKTKRKTQIETPIGKTLKSAVRKSILKKSKNSR